MYVCNGNYRKRRNNLRVRTMKATKVEHHSEFRIRIDFIYDSKTVGLIKQIEGARWSRSLQAWHIPYTKNAFIQLKEAFPDVEIVASPTPTKEIKPTEKLAVKSSQKTGTPEIHLKVTPTLIFVTLPKNEANIHYLRSFKFARWDSNNYQWIIPNYHNNIDLLKKYFQGRKTRLEEIESMRIDESLQPDYHSKQLLAVNRHNKTLQLYFAYNQAVMFQLKQIPLCRWNSSGNYWTLPFKEATLQQIRSIAEEAALEFVYQLVSQTKGAPRLPKHSNSIKCPHEYVAKLKELRYSSNTLAVYTDMFEEFMNFYPDKILEEISEEGIVLFLRYLVNERQVSISYQNQSINAIKFYYERVLRGSRKVYYIERPRKEQYLPEVLSEEEVAAILKVITNLKHKAIIMTIYSGGLRISEAINLKVKDIDSKRMQIRVEQAKGKKDRYPLLSQKTLLILRKYFKEYKPKEWLFEGEGGGQYSQKAIQNILKRAVQKAQIKKHITVHTLRHSFATHLLEAGTDIRYIQSLLGHNSSKTTEIYTHITTKGFNQIISPLDNLDV